MYDDGILSNDEKQLQCTIALKSRNEDVEECGGSIDIIEKWYAKIFTRASTRNSWGRIIEREIAILKIKYPFLTEKQIRGKAYKKFGIFTVMGEIKRQGGLKLRENCTKTYHGCGNYEQKIDEDQGLWEKSKHQFGDRDISMSGSFPFSSSSNDVDINYSSGKKSKGSVHRKPLVKNNDCSYVVSSRLTHFPTGNTVRKEKVKEEKNIQKNQHSKSNKPIIISDMYLKSPRIHTALRASKINLKRSHDHESTANPNSRRRETDKDLVREMHCSPVHEADERKKLNVKREILAEESEKIECLFTPVGNDESEEKSYYSSETEERGKKDDTKSTPQSSLQRTKHDSNLTPYSERCYFNNRKRSLSRSSEMCEKQKKDSALPDAKKTAEVTPRRKQFSVEEMPWRYSLEDSPEEFNFEASGFGSKARPPIFPLVRQGIRFPTNNQSIFSMETCNPSLNERLKLSNLFDTPSLSMKIETSEASSSSELFETSFGSHVSLSLNELEEMEHLNESYLVEFSPPKVRGNSYDESYDDSFDNKDMYLFSSSFPVDCKNTFESGLKNEDDKSIFPRKSTSSSLNTIKSLQTRSFDAPFSLKDIDMTEASSNSPDMFELNPESNNSININELNAIKDVDELPTVENSSVNVMADSCDNNLYNLDIEQRYLNASSVPTNYETTDVHDLGLKKKTCGYAFSNGNTLNGTESFDNKISSETRFNELNIFKNIHKWSSVAISPPNTSRDSYVSATSSSIPINHENRDTPKLRLKSKGDRYMTKGSENNTNFGKKFLSPTDSCKRTSLLLPEINRIDMTRGSKNNTNFGKKFLSPTDSYKRTSLLLPEMNRIDLNRTTSFNKYFSSPSTLSSSDALDCERNFPSNFNKSYENFNEFEEKYHNIKDSTKLLSNYSSELDQAYMKSELMPMPFIKNVTKGLQHLTNPNTIRRRDIKKQINTLLSSNVW